MPIHAYRKVFASNSLLQQFLRFEGGFLHHYNAFTPAPLKSTPVNMTPEYANSILRWLHTTPGLAQVFFDTRMVNNEKSGKPQDKVHCLVRTMSGREIDDKTSRDDGLVTFRRLMDVLEEPLRKHNDPVYNAELRSKIESRNCRSVFDDKFPACVKNTVKP
jgi:hypothetical protein